MSKTTSSNAFYVKSRFLHAKTTTPAKNGRVYRVLGHFDTPARAFPYWKFATVWGVFEGRIRRGGSWIVFLGQAGILLCRYIGPLRRPICLFLQHIDIHRPPGSALASLSKINFDKSKWHFDEFLGRGCELSRQYDCSEQHTTNNTDDPNKVICVALGDYLGRYCSK